MPSYPQVSVSLNYPQTPMRNVSALYSTALSPLGYLSSRPLHSDEDLIAGVIFIQLHGCVVTNTHCQHNYRAVETIITSIALQLNHSYSYAISNSHQRQRTTLVMITENPSSARYIEYNVFHRKFLFIYLLNSLGF